MLLDVASLLEAKEPITRIPFQERLEIPQDIGVLLSPATGEIVIERSADGSLLTIRGDLQIKMEITCDRCSGPFLFDQVVPVEEYLRVEAEASQTVEVEESVHPTGKLDLSDLLRQNVLLSLPLRKLCGCPELAGPPKGRTDPRWSKLEALKNQVTEEEE
jgi:uncharacterized metal-binding protein YceD (DUF177 family)